MVALYRTEKKMLKNFSKQSDYDNRVNEWQSNPKDSGYSHKFMFYIFVFIAYFYTEHCYLQEETEKFPVYSILSASLPQWRIYGVGWAHVPGPHLV